MHHVLLVAHCIILKKIYRAFNCIYGKTGGAALESVIMELLKFKCFNVCIMV